MEFLLYHDQKTIKHASADVGLIFIAFNLRRIFNLTDPNLMKKHLKMLDFVFDGFYNRFKAVISPFIFSQKQVGFYKLDFDRG